MKINIPHQVFGNHVPSHCHHMCILGPSSFPLGTLYQSRTDTPKSLACPLDMLGTSLSVGCPIRKKKPWEMVKTWLDNMGSWGFSLGSGSRLPSLKIRVNVGLYRNRVLARVCHKTDS